ncbi:MAG: NADH-quinone oxidoreductase subunit C [Actinomycetota bacterium]|nr:NADH-quinone oxidoreductase subunit C [Actinomycetota bacterium]
MAIAPTAGAGAGVPAAGSKEPMTAEAMSQHLRGRLESRLVDATVAYGQLTVTVAPQNWVAAARLCRDDPALACDFFDFLSAVDRGDDGFEVVVHLYSIAYRHKLTLLAMAPGGRAKPVMPTLTGLYRGANWHEREAYDMFGIDFEGHPGILPRILTIENFEGWPLRKEFLLTTREAKPWPGAKEPVEHKADEADDAGSATASEAPVEPQDKAAAAKAKAERAKAKAAAMRTKKARERAAELGSPESGGEDRDVAEQAEASAAQMATNDEATAAGRGEPGSDLIAESADELGGGDTEGASAAQAAAAGGEPEPQTPEGAAEIADSAIAKDAAAGASAGDTAARATQDAPRSGEPAVNPEAEAKAGEGAPRTASGTPGVEAEGRRDGAEDQSGAKSAAETRGMVSPTQDAEAARGAQETPAPTQGPRGSRAASPDDDVPVVPATETEEAPLTGDQGTDRETPRDDVTDDPGEGERR